MTNCWNEILLEEVITLQLDDEQQKYENDEPHSLDETIILNKNKKIKRLQVEKGRQQELVKELENSCSQLENSLQTIRVELGKLIINTCFHA